MVNLANSLWSQPRTRLGQQGQLRWPGLSQVLSFLRVSDERALKPMKNRGAGSR
jgi:hypothetical protein